MDRTMIDAKLNELWGDLFFSNVDPNSKRVKQFQTWLNQNPYVNELTLFHGTSAEFPIMSQGLLTTTKKRRNSYQSTSGFVYLSVFPSSARMFGQMAFPTKKIVVYAVTLTIAKLKPDLDQIKNKRIHAQLVLKNTLSHSMVFGHGARHKGPIELYKIKPTTDTD
jgi:hypothetical protein